MMAMSDQIMLEFYMNNYLWIFLQSTNNLSNAVISIFLSIFVWQKTGSIDYLFLFFLALFLTIPVSGFIGSYITEKFNFKTPVLISFMSQILLLFFAVNYSNYLIDNPILFGLINGVSIGFYAVPRNAVFQLMNKDSISASNSLLSVIGGLISLSVPVVGSLWISRIGNYNGIFILAGISILLGFVVNFFIKYPKSNGMFDVLVYKQFAKNKDFIKVIFLRFLDGIKGGIEWAFMGVITLGLIGGDLEKWGILNFFASLVGIGSGLFYMKVISKGYDKPALYLSSILYTFFGIFLLVSFGLVNFVFYLFGTTITSSFIGSAVSKLWSDVFDESGGGSYNSSEFFSILEIPLMLGRVIPIFILFFNQIDLSSKVNLGMLFILISTIPLLSTYVLQRTKALEV